MNPVIFGVSVYPSILNRPLHLDTDRVAYSGMSMSDSRKEIAVSQEGDDARTDFPETWLWDLYVLP